MESFPEMTSKVGTLVRAAGIEDPGRVSGAGRERPDPEVPERARRRTFTAKYKLEILAAYAAAPDGEKGALLRREGLYSSHLAAWRAAQARGELANEGSKRRGPQAKTSPREVKRILQLERENRRWRARAERAEALVEVQKKLSALLHADDDGRTEPR
jgi:hypothetical protein